MASKEVGDSYERECRHCGEVKTFTIKQGDLPGETMHVCEDWEDHAPLFGD